MVQRLSRLRSQPAGRCGHTLPHQQQQRQQQQQRGRTVRGLLVCPVPRRLDPPHAQVSHTIVITLPRSHLCKEPFNNILVHPSKMPLYNPLTIPLPPSLPPPLTPPGNRSDHCWRGCSRNCESKLDPCASDLALGRP